MRVEIFDQSYHLRGEVDEPCLQELARYVDEKLRTVAASTRTLDTQRVAVLAALNIADELFALRRRTETLETQLRQRAERALAAIDLALKEAG
jgi:cell division protein ZapA